MQVTLWGVLWDLLCTCFVSAVFLLWFCFADALFYKSSVNYRHDTDCTQNRFAHAFRRVPKGECPLRPQLSSATTYLLIFAVVLRASL